MHNIRAFRTALIAIALCALAVGFILNFYFGLQTGKSSPVSTAGNIANSTIPTVGNVAKDPREVPPPPKRTDGGPQEVKIILVAREVWAELTPGKKFLFWTFNGTVPGPMLRVTVGDYVNLTLINGLTSSENQEPHNIDFHAVMGPGGGASVTNVKPGETKWVRFKALREGSYIYHCAGEDKPWEHIAHGMYGLIDVEPQGGLSPVDKEFYIGQSEWYIEQDEKNGPGFFNLDDEKATLEHPDLYTFNGHFNALNQLKTNDTKGSMIFNMTTKQGDKVRLFFVDGGPNVGSNFHIIGTIFDRVYTAHSEDYVRNEETVYVPPGSAAVFELQTPVPGDYSLVDHALWRVPRGALGILHVNQTGLWPSDVYAPEP